MNGRCLMRGETVLDESCRLTCVGRSRYDRLEPYRFKIDSPEFVKQSTN